MAVPFDRALLALAMQPNPDTFVVPNRTTDALLIASPNFNPDIQRIQRDVVRPSMSPFPGRNGRIRAGVTFRHDVVGSGNTDGTVAPVLDKLLRCCGFAATAIEDAGLIQSWGRQGNTGRMTITPSNALFDLPVVRYVTLTCTTGGGSGTAEVSITAPASEEPDGTPIPAVNLTGVELTNATPFSVGHGCQVAVNIDAPLVIGDRWVLQLAPPGYLYTPVSVGFEAGSLEAYYDGIRHRSGNCRGSVKLEATAGQIAQFEFELQGDWQDPTDIAMPEDAVYSDLVPPQVELADIRVDNALTACPSTFGFDMANEIALRECANAAQGYAGAEIVGRAPTLNFNPEFGPEGNYPYWGRLSSAAEIDFSFTIGTELGNSCHVLSHCQIANLQYADRNKQRIYNVELEAVSRFGNDELSLYFF